MYESPIELTFEPMETIAEAASTEIDGQIKEAVIKATRNVRIEVNEGELIKALSYDRGQYEKGYSDGVASRDHITLGDVMDYIDGMPDDDWETLASFLEYRGWELKRQTEDPDLAAIKDAALQAGFEGKEVRFYIGGRLFAIRELPG